MTAMRPDRLLGLLSSLQMNRGAAMSMLSTGERTRTLTPAQRSFLKAVIDQGRKTTASTAHPENEANRGQYKREKGQDLTAVELAWIDRLPLDPKQVTFDDAVQLAVLAGSVSKMKTPASARLIDSVWLPVKAIHDLRRAEANLKNAEAPLPPVPADTVEAIADAIEDSHPTATPDMVMVEANRIVSEFTERRKRNHAQDIERAQKSLAATKEEISRREALTRDPAQ